MTYDTLIIGAGLSGLAAGIRLAYFEKRVCILERHTTIGGLNSFYRLRGRNHDVGLHAVTNYAPPGTNRGPLSKILRQLRLNWEDFDLRPQLGSSIVFPGCRLRFSNHFEQLQAEIAERFPRQADGFRRLLRTIDEHNDRDLNPPALSARAVVGRHITDPLLVDMLFCPILFYGSATPHDIDFTLFVILFKSLFYEGFGRPREGIRPILRTLVRKFKSLGGELRLRSGVRSIVAEGDRAAAVVLDNGETVEARNILSSAGLVETMRLCGPERSVSGERSVVSGRSPAPFTTHHSPLTRPGEISFLETIFILDRPPAELGHSETIVFYNDRPRFRYERPDGPADLRSGIIACPNNFAFDEPLEEGRLRVTVLADPGYWMDLPEEEYHAQKDLWRDRIAESALSHVPDFRPHVIDADIFTPRTIHKFTGHVNGAVYGAPKKHLDGRTHLKNLYLCGTDQGYLGIIGSMLSGISMANAYLLR